MLADPVAAPEDVGLSSERLRRIQPLFDTYIDNGVIAGAVTLVARNGKIAHLGAHGHMDVAAGKWMRPDAIFRLASMTKPIVGVAILQLLEEGKVHLNDPISDFIPAFKNLQVAVSNPTAPSYIATTVPTGGYHLVPSEREVTIRDLLTHTSGLGSATAGRASRVDRLDAGPPGEHYPRRVRAAHVLVLAELPTRRRLGVLGHLWL